MDEKLAYYTTNANAPPPPNMSGRLVRRKNLWPAALVVLVFFYGFWGYVVGQPAIPHARFIPQQAPVVEQNAKLVPLEAHIMSKCPDARLAIGKSGDRVLTAAAQDCLRDLVLPTMMKTYQKVNFTLSYIGTPTENDGIDCKHGPSECMGNIIELCAAHLYPDPKINLGFTMCLTREYQAIPERSLVEDCALEHAIDIKELNDCATQDDGALGLGMLRDSVRRSKDVNGY
ncbi:hypothetical protein COL922a_008651 [Colletotrichum nupharicola]|nr:hypothetical protein COL922a_008651 [Colletotrichum nupharicola]